MANFEYFIEANSGTGGYEIAPEGSHRAVCIGLAMMGTHESTFEGEKKRQKKVRFFFEIPNETEGNEPYEVSKQFNFSWHKQSNLRPFINTWRGRAFSDDELNKFNIASVIGAPCALTIQHTVSATSGKTRPEVKTVTPLMKGLAKPTPTKTLFLYDVEKHDQATFDMLPPVFQAMIKESEEWQNIGKAPAPVTAPAPALVVASEDEEDLPF
jgi:hypothetical protein